MIKKLVLLFVCLTLSASRRRSRIHFGNEVTQSEMNRYFPFVVSVEICTHWECKFCTGSLISRNKVLVAAHCFCASQNRKRSIYVSMFLPWISMVSAPLLTPVHLPIQCHCRLESKFLSTLLFCSMMLIVIHNRGVTNPTYRSNKCLLFIAMYPCQS